VPEKYLLNAFVCKFLGDTKSFWIAEKNLVQLFPSVLSWKTQCVLDSVKAEYFCVLFVTDALSGELSSVLNAGLSGLGAPNDNYDFSTDFVQTLF